MKFKTMLPILLFLSSLSACIDTPRNSRLSENAENSNNDSFSRPKYFSIMTIKDNDLPNYPMVHIPIDDIKIKRFNGEWLLDIGFELSGIHGSHLGVRMADAEPAPGEPWDEQNWGSDTIMVPVVRGKANYRAKFVLIDHCGGQCHYKFPAYFSNRIQIRSYELNSFGNIVNFITEAEIYIYIIEKFNAANEVIGYKVTDKWAEHNAWMEKRDKIDYAESTQSQPQPAPPVVQQPPQPQPAPPVVQQPPQPQPAPPVVQQPPQPQPAPPVVQQPLQPQPAPPVVQQPPQPQPAPPVVQQPPQPQPAPPVVQQPQPQPQQQTPLAPESKFRGIEFLSPTNARQWKVCNDARWAAWYATKNGRIAKLDLESIEASDPNAYHYIKREGVIYYSDQHRASWTTEEVERAERQYGVWLPKSRMTAMLEEGLRPDFAPRISDRNDPRYQTYLQIQQFTYQADAAYTKALYNAALWLFGKEKMESKKHTSSRMALRINFSRDMHTPAAYDKLYRMFNYHKTYCGHRACDIDIDRQRSGPSPCSPFIL